MILTGKSAENFIKKANENLKNRKTVDIVKRMTIAKAIIKKSKLNLN